MKTEVHHGTVYLFNLEYCSCVFVGFYLKKIMLASPINFLLSKYSLKKKLTTTSHTIKLLKIIIYIYKLVNNMGSLVDYVFFCEQFMLFDILILENSSDY